MLVKQNPASGERQMRCFHVMGKPETSVCSFSLSVLVVVLKESGKVGDEAENEDDSDQAEA